MAAERAPQGATSRRAGPPFPAGSPGGLRGAVHSWEDLEWLHQAFIDARREQVEALLNPGFLPGRTLLCTCEGDCYLVHEVTGVSRRPDLFDTGGGLQAHLECAKVNETGGMERPRVELLLPLEDMGAQVLLAALPRRATKAQRRDLRTRMQAHLPSFLK